MHKSQILKFFIIQKRIMDATLSSKLKDLCLRFFLKSNSLPPFLIIAQQCLQFTLYLLIVHSPTFITDILTTNYNLLGFIGLLLAVLILMRIKYGNSIFKLFYPIMLNIIISQQYYKTQRIAFIYLLLITLLIIVDTLSNIKLDFSPQSITSESINVTKIIHINVFVFGIVYSSLQSQPMILHLVSGVLFFVLIIAKRGSLMRNGNFKELILRFYLLIGFDHFVTFLNSIVNLPLYVLIFLPIVVSQLSYELYKRKKTELKIEQMYSQQAFFQLCFKICNYINGKLYDSKFQQQINNFVSDQVTSQMRQHQKKLLVYQKITNLLARQQYFQNYLLLALIYTVYKHQLLKSKQAIQVLKKNVKYDPIEHILIYRAEEILYNSFLQKNHEIIFDHYQSLYQCDQFRTLLLKASIHYINFWEFTRKPEIVTEDFRKISDKTVDYQRKINKNYQNIETKCVTTSILYVSYLFEVARDTMRARKILEKLCFNEDFEVNLQINQKIFIKIQMLEDVMKIQKIGHNISNFLGFDRKEIQGQKIDIFLPQFYKKIHKEKVDTLIQNSFQSFHLFNKKTIIKNKQNFYLECNIVFRLHYDFRGELRLQGYLQVKQNLKYVWSHYLITNQNDQIVECSQNFSDIYPNQSKLRKTEQFFTQKRQNSKIKYHNQSKYFPLLNFNITQNQSATYFVEISEDYNQRVVEVANQKIMTLMNSIKGFKADLSFMKSYYQAMKTSLAQLFHKEYIILFAVSFILIMGIVACESLFFYTMRLKEQTQTTIVTNTSNIVYYMNSFNKLGLDVNYIDLNKHLNYTNNFTTFDLINQSLSLQVYAESMRYLSVSSFSMPSFLPNVTFSKLGFDIVMQFISNAYMIKQFQDDPFTQNLSISRQRLILPTLYTGISVEYRNNYQTQVSGLSFYDQVINLILIIVILVLLIAIYLIIVRLELKIRRNEKEALSLPLTVRQQDNIIQNIKVFIKKITLEEISYKGQSLITKSKFKNYQTSFAPDVTVISKDPRSQVSMRELSGRNLMDDTLNKTLFLQSQQTHRNQTTIKAELPLNSVEVKLGDRKKLTLVLPLIFIVLILALIVTNQIKNNVMMNIDQANSTQNIFLLTKLGTGFVRVMNGFMNTLCRKMANYTVSSTAYFANFKSVPVVPPIITFEESALAQFTPFTNLLINFETQYLCEYISCDPRFANDINIVYSATVQKIIQYMNNFINTTLSLSYSDFKNQMTQPSTLYNLDLFFYCGNIINAFLDKIYRTYVDCYRAYTNDLISSKTLLMSIALCITVIGSIFLLIYYRSIYINQLYLKDVISLVKTESYINEDTKWQDERQKDEPQESEIKSIQEQLKESN